jgi:hypothetical protein
MNTIEPLESRIAPAILVNATTLTYFDIDGDLVTVKVSKGKFVDPGISTDDFTFVASNLGGEYLRLLDFSNDGGEFQGANISITATPSANGGDGLVNIGDIYATGSDLGTVVIDGDLLAITAGNPAQPGSACKGLTVQSLGRFSTGFSTLTSSIDGKLDKLTVKSDVFEAIVNVTDSAGANGRIGTVFVGGSVIGGFGNGSGQIFAEDGMGQVTIKRDIVGGHNTTSGSITAEGDIGSVTVGGSLIGGDAPTSGVIFSSLGTIGTVKIGRDLVGGDGINTGRVFGREGITSVTIGGSIIASPFGIATDNAKVHSDKTIGLVKVGGSIVGGNAMRSGAIEANNLGPVTLGGSLVGGRGDDSGKIATGSAMGAVKIGKDIHGGAGTAAGSIAAGSSAGNITVGGSLLGGENSRSGSILSGAAMGAVKIAGDATAGPGGSTGLIYSMGSLAGVSVGGSLKFARGTVPLTAGAGNDPVAQRHPIGATILFTGTSEIFDFTAFEAALT